jgi:hypothetical protein
MEIIVLGEFWEFTLNYEENCGGGIYFWWFWGFWAGVHVSPLRWGDSFVCILCVWRNVLSIGWVLWGITAEPIPQIHSGKHTCKLRPLLPYVAKYLRHFPLMCCWGLVRKCICKIWEIISGCTWWVIIAVYGPRSPQNKLWVYGEVCWAGGVGINRYDLQHC